MKTEKKIGIWIDHSSAHLMELRNDPIETIIIASKLTLQDKEHSLDKGENLMHNKEQNKQSEYYKKLSQVIKNYEDVLLFGPTDEKIELFNILRADDHFEKINIKIKQTDKMTENQQHAFVKEYFNTSKVYTQKLAK